MMNANLASTSLFSHHVGCSANLLCVVDRQNGPYPQYGWDFPGEIPENRKDPGNALGAFPAISLESTAGKPQAL